MFLRHYLYLVSWIFFNNHNMTDMSLDYIGSKGLVPEPEKIRELATGANVYWFRTSGKQIQDVF